MTGEHEVRVKRSIQLDNWSSPHARRPSQASRDAAGGAWCTQIQRRRGRLAASVRHASSVALACGPSHQGQTVTRSSPSGTVE